MNAIGIDEELAQISRLTWSKADAIRQASAVVSHLSGVVVSWDEGDEDWIQLMGRAIVCYVHVKRPFVMVLRDFADALSGALDGQVVVLVIESWTDRSLSADLAALRNAFPGYILPDALPSGSADAFSAEDLWFATD